MRLVEHRVVWISAVVAGAYWLAGAFLPTQPWLEIVRIVQATCATAALVALSGGIWDALRRHDPDRADALLIGTGLTQFAFATSGIWLLLYRLAYAPDIPWMLSTLTFGFVAGWLPALASLLIIAVPGVLRRDAHGAEVPPATLIAVGCVAGAGVFAALVVLSIQPNALRVVEALRPWVH